MKKEIRNSIIIIITLLLISICFGIKEPFGSRLRYIFRGSVGQKYIYQINNYNIQNAVVSQSREGAEDIAKVIKGEIDSFNFTTMNIGTYVSCSAKRELRDTVKIDGVLFAIIQYTHGTGRLSVTEYLYVPEKFLFDDVNGECTENR
ncbi:MAG: hypothetical protein ACO1PI_13755 [Bacteroidota bacterium]